MRVRERNPFLLCILLAGLLTMPVGRGMAQTVTTLHDFTALNTATNQDGATPYAGLLLLSNLLYGTTYAGGASNRGIVFAIRTDGTGFTNLHSFTGGSDGASPFGGLVSSGKILFGTTQLGGASSNGTVFAINTNGTGFTNLHSFTATSTNSPYGNNDGSQPFAGLVLSGNMLYGAAQYGGTSGHGAVFAINTNGAGFTNFHSFTGGSDGGNPIAGMIMSSNMLYGTAFLGGSLSGGTVFAISTNGAGFTNLHGFAGGSEGVYPEAPLVISSNTLYGTTASGGSSSAGTIFKVNTDGNNFKTLHSFPARSGTSATNMDGAFPYAGLCLSGNMLYGTAEYGGASGHGTIFAIDTGGTVFTTLHSFTAGNGMYQNVTNDDGANPQAGLILSGGTLYGTADHGGSLGLGTIFKLSFPPRLAIIHSGANIILTWPTNVDGFDSSEFTLQSTTNKPTATAWTTVSPPPVAINGSNTVTNTLSGAMKFYRLIQ